MTYLYVKALHIIFVVTWFAGLFYIVRLFIYNREAQDKAEPEKTILKNQFNIMIRRLWFGITWPSCILTLIFGIWLLFYYANFPVWLWIKLAFVLGLLLYHLSLHVIYKQQRSDVFNYSSNQLRIWNEVATIFLVAIVMLVIVRSGLGLVWAVLGLAAFTLLLLAGIRLYKLVREK
jgi:protoporphyrinogen IX oxidase